MAEETSAVDIHVQPIPAKCVPTDLFTLCSARKAATHCDTVPLLLVCVNFSSPATSTAVTAMATPDCHNSF